MDEYKLISLTLMHMNPWTQHSLIRLHWLDKTLQFGKAEDQLEDKVFMLSNLSKWVKGMCACYFHKEFIGSDL